MSLKSRIKALEVKWRKMKSEDINVVKSDSKEGYKPSGYLHEKSKGLTLLDLLYSTIIGVMGGIISSLLDGAMNKVLFYHDKTARTGKLSVRFKKETDTTDPLFIVGEVVKMRKHFALTKAEIQNQKKELVAVGKAIFILKE